MARRGRRDPGYRRKRFKESRESMREPAVPPGPDPTPAPTKPIAWGPVGLLPGQRPNFFVMKDALPSEVGIQEGKFPGIALKRNYEFYNESFAINFDDFANEVARSSDGELLLLFGKHARLFNEAPTPTQRWDARQLLHAVDVELSRRGVPHPYRTSPGNKIYPVLPAAPPQTFREKLVAILRSDRSAERPDLPEFRSNG